MEVVQSTKQRSGLLQEKRKNNEQIKIMKYFNLKITVWENRKIETDAHRRHAQSKNGS